MIHKTIKIANIGSIFNFTINQMLVKKLNKIAEAIAIEVAIIAKIII